MGLGRLVARSAIGGLFVGHGMQKLAGWFEGPGLDAAGGMMDSLGLRPGRRNAIAASATEAGGGALLAAGLFTPLAATGLIATMITAIRTVHLPKGVWNQNGGYEYNLALIAALLAIVEAGPGPLSLDHLRGRDGGGSVLLALAAAAAGSTLVIEAGRRFAEPAGEAAAGGEAEAAEAAQPAA